MKGPDALRPIAPPAQISEMQRLQMLNEISRVLSSNLDLSTVYDAMYEQISRVMDTSMFFVALTHASGTKAHLPYVREFGNLTLDVITPEGKSVTTHVLERGGPLLFHTAEQYERYAMSHGLPVIILGDESEGGAEAMIYAPLNTGSTTIGALSVQSTRQYAYTRDDLDTLTVIAGQAAIAIQNARLYQASLDSSQRRQALLRVAETVTGTLELGAVLDSILGGIREVLPYHLAAILLPNEKSDYLDTVGAVGAMAEEQRKAMKVPFGRGVTGRAFNSGETIVVDDVSRFEDYIPGSEGVQSEVAVPLKRSGTTVGVLNLERAESGAFSQDDVELLTLFGAQAAIAIENARLFEEQQARVLEMQAIQQLVEHMTGRHRFDSIATVIEEGIRKLIDIDVCIVYLLDEATSSVVPVLSQDDTESPQLVPRRPRRLGEGVSGSVALSGKSTIFDSTKSDARVSKDVREANFDMSVIGAPMWHQGKVIGVITAGKNGPGQFKDSHLRILDIIAAHAAIGFDRCRLYEELHLQATTDELTGLFNRRYLAYRLNEEKSRALRNRHPLAALMLDADNFKLVNDHFGHDAGDVVLQELADLIRTEVRTEDIVARYGGEEFLVLLPEVTTDGAVIVADRLCRMISQSPLGAKAGVKHVEVSIGIAVLHPGDEDDEIITRADSAMYQAKRSGGNRLCIYENGSYRFMDNGCDEKPQEPAA